MLKIKFYFFLLLTSASYSQDGWTNFADENEINIKITENTKKFKVNYLEFVSVWDSKMTPNEKYEYLGGIKNLKIYFKNKQIDEHVNLPDNIGLGYVLMRFYDYNFDGFLDFTVQVDCGGSCYSSYYLYDEKLKKFVYQKEWNISIQKINKKEKLILTQPEGMVDDRSLFRVNDDKLIKIKRINLKSK
ncbi:XAC2610-related protein [Polaribacter ponticola]|uniref:Uncharacterized protein n=1 Tax=Polaribacter ponticola TaxID=2978475 RepID=A0ABT5S513_9FLAO|nr:hypothetical protein [Polaribacter sp. MSW5]MDD7913193.1 hypothetical protein [Polaribacter sp. MSW5]